MNHIHQDDLFCLYCQKQYKSGMAFGRHVSTKHSGVWEGLKIREPYIKIEERLEIERQTAECENPF